MSQSNEVGSTVLYNEIKHLEKVNKQLREDIATNQQHNNDLRMENVKLQQQVAVETALRIKAEGQ